MKSKEVIDLLKQNDFKEKVYVRSKVQYNSESRKLEKEEYNILEFDFIFINEKETELYIIEEKESLFTHEEIEVFNVKIAAFHTLMGNSPIKYNINLLLLCPLHLQNLDKEREASIRKILGHERDKYNCRKIFLDTANSNFEEELSILPSIPIDVEIKNTSIGYEGLLEKVKEVLGESLYTELNRLDEEINLHSVVQHLNVKDENNG
ncbi:hypothetical protein IRV08_18230 [Bacillus cereus]|uniref:Uncharacterized protein n=1 Tax=Bacillus cereus (strain AH820) TaxID=405535 RepID=B7JQX6_BACC0|nr:MULTISPECIES: hypothetical protein [Bacillus cereus group]ACK91498.1 conserved hypothetical protein [Bacillus cereus AH820]MBL3821611.1 hypothetical protein [Bacillus cereus]MCU5008534.1 hypothetical protein [Bacillus pacificus]MDZ4466117.1 hypothetical protein [Bacillus cereus]